ncbi:MAG: NADH:flavin oxidoreductase [Anaerolineae bacterium]|nr:NADH:flavin oxidoreductase [Anaerolineae bacterium]
MTDLFSPGSLGRLSLPNRIVRSATAERMADDEGRPRPALAQLYQALASGGVGLIISGHLYVDPGGKCHPEMTGIYDDKLIGDLSTVVDAVHAAGGRVAAQINHGGAQCSSETVPEPVAPSDITADYLQQPARGMTEAEILQVIRAYAHAARRARQAGFDAVQLHGAHGYLINQFLSPFTNRRSDSWGGDLTGRMRFLREICSAVQDATGPDYPVFIKLGMVDAVRTAVATGVEDGLTLEESQSVVAELESMGLCGVEVSGGIGNTSSRMRIRNPEDEAYFRDLARAAREVTRLPIMLVGGLRSRQVMEDVLESGDADFVSLCRPLISEPDLPRRMEAGQERSACISANRCWPQAPNEGIACRCTVQRSG